MWRSMLLEIVDFSISYSVSDGLWLCVWVLRCCKFWDCQFHNMCSKGCDYVFECLCLLSSLLGLERLGNSDPILWTQSWAGGGPRPGPGPGDYEPNAKLSASVGFWPHGSVRRKLVAVCRCRCYYRGLFSLGLIPKHSFMPCQGQNSWIGMKSVWRIRNLFPWHQHETKSYSSRRHLAQGIES